MLETMESLLNLITNTLLKMEVVDIKLVKKLFKIKLMLAYPKIMLNNSKLLLPNNPYPSPLKLILIVSNSTKVVY